MSTRIQSSDPKAGRLGSTLEKTLRLLTLISLLVLVSMAAPTIHPAKATALAPHFPISIVGTSGFTPANGTTLGGNGSISNPYIIEGWNIDTTTANIDGIIIEQTNASFIIRNVYIHGQGRSNGIFFLNVANGVVDDITITSSYDGITITLSNATVENSHISTNAEHGIKIVDGESINLFNNTFTLETGAGIYSESCVKCNLNITRNTITSNLSGIVLLSMSNTFIYENNISSNTYNGISVYKSTYGFIVLNNITFNDVGVNLAASASKNLVHHNNFVQNRVQAFDNKTGQNMWDVGYASGGNYWNDYLGVDHCSGLAQNVCTRSDGIGDTPYTFANARDNYPLMKFFVQTVIHDVAVSSIIPSATSVNRNETLSVTVVVKNEGAATENFTLTLYYDSTLIGSQTIPPLAPSTSQTVPFNWNTTGVPAGLHNLKATASTVWGEIDVADNILAMGQVEVKIPTVTTPTPPSSPPATQSSTSPSSYLPGAIAALLIVSLLALTIRRTKRRARSLSRSHRGR